MLENALSSLVKPTLSVLRSVVTVILSQPLLIRLLPSACSLLLTR